MKKIVALVLVLALCLSMVACKAQARRLPEIRLRGGCVAGHGRLAGLALGYHLRLRRPRQRAAY